MQNSLKSFDDTASIGLTRCLVEKIAGLNFTLPAAMIALVTNYRKDVDASLKDVDTLLVDNTNLSLSPLELDAFVKILADMDNPNLSNKFLLACKDILPDLIFAIKEAGESLEGVLYVNNPMRRSGRELLEREAISDAGYIVGFYLFNTYLQSLISSSDNTWTTALGMINVLAINLSLLIYITGAMLGTRKQYHEICSIMPTVENTLDNINWDQKTQPISSLSPDDILKFFYSARNVEKCADDATASEFDDTGHQIREPLLHHLKAFVLQLNTINNPLA